MLLFASFGGFGVHQALAQVDEPVVIECPSGTVATYFGCQMAPAPGVTYVKNWGALARTGTATGWQFVTGYANESKAQKALLAACRKTGTSCQPYLTFLNQCVAVARVNDARVAGPGKDSIHNGSEFEATKASAVKACQADWGAKSCTVVAAQCSVNRIER